MRKMIRSVGRDDFAIDDLLYQDDMRLEVCQNLLSINLFGDPE